MDGKEAQAILARIVADARYLKNIEYGKPRPGHAEGTVKAHIAELEANLDILNSRGYVTFDHYWSLKLLIHVHDSFKADAVRDSPILYARSHATLAKNFLTEFLFDPDMLAIVQYHDLGLSMYRRFLRSGIFSEITCRKALDAIEDKDLFVLFCIVDGCTKSKGRECIVWWLDQLNRLYPAEIMYHEEHIIAGPMLVGDAW